MTVIMSALFGKKLKKSEIKKKTTTMNQFVFITDENDNFFLYKMDMYVVLGSFEL